MTEPRSVPSKILNMMALLIGRGPEPLILRLCKIILGFGNSQIRS